MDGEPECKLAEGFSVWEKAYAQLSFLLMGIVGTVGIVISDWPWVLPYIVIYWYGIPCIVMRFLVCPRCPHLHEYGDCLQAPVSLTRWLSGERKDTPLSKFEKLLFYGIFILIPFYPLYWLMSNTVLLMTFVVGAVAWYLGQYVRFCRRCRVSSCPFNRVRLTPRVSKVGT